MRIAYVTETYPPEINGVALTVARTVAHLRANGHDVELIRPRQAGEHAGPAESDEDDAHAWRSSGWPIPVYREMRFGIARPATLARRMRALRVQLVHVATEGPLGWAAISAARSLGLATSSDFRTNFDRYCAHYRLGWSAPVVRSYLRRFHNRTGCSFVPTRQVRRELVTAGYRRVEVVGRGVDSERYAPRHRDESLRASWGVERADPVLLHVGRLAPEKNVDLAIASFRCAQAAQPRARMVVVGDGPLRRRLQREHADIVFTGQLRGDALAAHYASADVFLFPSLTDTFGNVTLEAMASGLPVVAFDTAAAAEHLRDGFSGALVPVGSDARYLDRACQITLAHGDDRVAADMRRQARIAALQADWPRVLARFEHRLSALVDEHEQASALAPWLMREPRHDAATGGG